MDEKLAAWARAVKSRQRRRGGVRPLWLFTDPARMPDLAGTVSALPPGLCGVVFRHDTAGDRAELLQQVWRICRAGRVPLVVAGRGPRPHGVGCHHRAGRGPMWRGFSTASAHGVADLVRASRGGAGAVFLSPAYATRSHPGARAMGPMRWLAMARRVRIPVLALGGIDGATVRRLGRRLMGVGAIGALV